MIRIDIALYGTFRRFSALEPLWIETEPTSVANIKSLLAERFCAHDTAFDTGLLEVTRLASDHEILSDDRILDQSQTLALIPPVSGG